MHQIVDIIIIILLILGALVGFKEGAIKRLTSFIGTLIIAIIAFKFKNNLSVIMYENLPFLHFGSLIRGIETINILIYEILAFLLIFIGLLIILKTVIVISGLVEKLIKMTIFLNLPSKILGIFVGLFEAYIYVFIILIIITIPMFHTNKIINNSKIATTIINKTPILSSLAKDTINTYTEVYTKLENKENKTSEELNTEIIKILLDNKIVTIESVDKLIERGKIHLSDEQFLENYRM